MAISLDTYRSNVIQEKPLASFNGRILQEIFSYCTGDELRRFELTSRFYKEFFRHPKNGHVWFVMLQHELPQKQLITFHARINYRVLHLLFCVKTYRPQASSYLWVRFFKSRQVSHPDPEKHLDSKCFLDCCKNQEAQLYKTLVTGGRHYEFFRQTFNVLSSTLGTRGLYDGSGNRILWCRDCDRYKSAKHGAPESGTNYTECESHIAAIDDTAFFP